MKMVDNSGSRFAGFKKPVLASEEKVKNKSDNPKKNQRHHSWLIPGVDGTDLQLPTVEELEHIRKEAYEEGFLEGKKNGYTAGFKNGSDDLKKDNLHLLTDSLRE